MALASSERVVAALKVLLNGLPSDEAAQLLAIYLSSNPSVAQALLSLMQVNSSNAQGLTRIAEVTAMGLEGVAGSSTPSRRNKEEGVAGSSTPSRRNQEEVCQNSPGMASSRTPNRSALSGALVSPTELRDSRRAAQAVALSPLKAPALHRRPGATVDTASQPMGREAAGYGAANNKASGSMSAVEFTMKPRELQAQQKPKSKPAQSDVTEQRSDAYVMGYNTMYKAQHMLCRLNKAAAPAQPPPAQLRVRRSLALQPKEQGRAAIRSTPVSQSMPVL